jgi:hypothetical protein
MRRKEKKQLRFYLLQYNSFLLSFTACYDYFLQSSLIFKEKKTPVRSFYLPINKKIIKTFA